MNKVNSSAMENQYYDLVDINDVHIDMNQCKEDRIENFIKQIKNPYLFKCGNFVIESVFADDDITLQDRLKQHFRMV